VLLDRSAKHGLRATEASTDIGDRNHALRPVGPWPVAQEPIVERLLRVEGALVFGANCIRRRPLSLTKDLACWTRAAALYARGFPAHAVVMGRYALLQVQ